MLPYLQAAVNFSICSSIYLTVSPSCCKFLDLQQYLTVSPSCSKFPDPQQYLPYLQAAVTLLRPRWLGRWPASLSRSISWVQVSPSTCSLVAFSGKKELVWRKARERELATFDDNRRAMGMLNPMKKKKRVPGGRRVDTCDHGFSTSSSRVKTSHDE